eukprot:1152849-Pelagomonas_calceolata.AAC.3
MSDMIILPSAFARTLHTVPNRQSTLLASSGIMHDPKVYFGNQGCGAHCWSGDKGKTLKARVFEASFFWLHRTVRFIEK